MKNFLAHHQRRATSILSASLFSPYAAEAASKRPSTKAKCIKRNLDEALDYIKSHPEIFLINQGIPMSYEPTDAKSNLPPPLHNILSDHVSDDTLNSTNSKHYFNCILSLLCLPFGELDRAHNLVTPLSWGSFTSYAGPPVLDSPAAIEASHIHSMIHRAEGKVEGEFGTGWLNAAYWGRVAEGSGGNPFSRRLIESTRELTAGCGISSLEKLSGGEAFDQSLFVYCVRTGLEKNDKRVIDLCSKIVEKEWWLMMEHCLSFTNLA